MKWTNEDCNVIEYSSTMTVLGPDHSHDKVKIRIKYDSSLVKVYSGSSLTSPEPFYLVLSTLTPRTSC